MAAFKERMTDLMRKYGKVALGVHLSVSTASITGLYIAIKNNVDVEAIFQRVGLSSRVQPSSSSETDHLQDTASAPPPTTTNRTAAMAASSGGALALALLCNKALFPVRVPITIALTPPIARYLARRRLHL